MNTQPKTYPLEKLRQAWGAGKMSAKDEFTFFHSYHENGNLNWQGKAIKTLPNGKVLVQLYSWMDGSPTDQVLLSREEMQDFVFYKSQNEWVAAADEYNALQARKVLKET